MPSNHLQRVRDLGCIVCRRLGYGETPASAHHIRTGQGMGQKAPDTDAIGLCFHHHQGKEGIHTLGTKVWQAKYWQETDLLAETRRLLENEQ